MQSGRRSGFSLLELVLVVLLLSIFAGSLAPGLAHRHAEARDARRLADMHVLVGAIEQYNLERGYYPTALGSAAHDGFEVSHQNGFLGVLVREGFLRESVLDPLNDEQHHYAYRRYPRGSHGCVGGPFYVLGVRRMETDKHTEHTKLAFACSGRDWNTEFALVTGGGARAGSP